MKKHHIAAIACFAAAAFFYFFASTKVSAAGFGVLGLVFELVGWGKLFKGDKE